MCTIFISHMRN